MERLTKEIAESIRKKHNISKFFFYGLIRGYEFFLGVSPNGGKTGFPCVFGIDEQHNVTYVTDFETLGIVRKSSKSLERVFL